MELKEGLVTQLLSCLEDFLFFLFFIGSFSKTKKKTCTNFQQEALEKCCVGTQRV